MLSASIQPCSVVIRQKRRRSQRARLGFPTRPKLFPIIVMLSNTPSLLELICVTGITLTSLSCKGRR